MSIHFASETEVSNWNQLILNNPDGGNILQGVEFSHQKEQDGWTPRFILAGSLAITILEKSILGLGKLWYIPKGPGITSTRKLDDLLPELRGFATKDNVFLIKLNLKLKLKMKLKPTY